MMIRVHRRWIAWIALAALLFTQFAVAAYVCPGWFSSNSNTAMLAAADVTQTSMPDCSQPDMKQPGLCHVHCHDGKQSADKAEVPPIVPLLALGFILVLLTVPVVQRSLAVSQSPHLRRATAPPLSIRNFCFRI